MLYPVTGEDAASMIAERLLKAVSISFKVFGHSVQGGASVGLMVVQPGTNPRSGSTMLRRLRAQRS